MKTNLGPRNFQASIGRCGGRAIGNPGTDERSGGGTADIDPARAEANDPVRVVLDSEDSPRGGAAGGTGGGAGELAEAGADAGAPPDAGGPSVDGEPPEASARAFMAALTAAQASTSP